MKYREKNVKLYNRRYLSDHAAAALATLHQISHRDPLLATYLSLYTEILILNSSIVIVTVTFMARTVDLLHSSLVIVIVTLIKSVIEILCWHVFFLMKSRSTSD